VVGTTAAIAMVLVDTSNSDMGRLTIPMATPFLASITSTVVPVLPVVMVVAAMA